jgi:hypothetical protein
MKSLWHSMKFQALTPRLKIAPNVCAQARVFSHVACSALLGDNCIE